jgi:hypothetical protein
MVAAMSEEHPVEPMLQFFEYAHLPQHLQRISIPFGSLASALVNMLPSNPERTAALRKLLEAKDCAVRASKITTTSATITERKLSGCASVSNS